VIDWVAVRCFLQILLVAVRFGPLSPYQVSDRGPGQWRIGDRSIRVLETTIPSGYLVLAVNGRECGV
jgi:hypothetical protein